MKHMRIVLWAAFGLMTTSILAQPYTVLKSFGVLTNVTGVSPGQLALGLDGSWYGVCSSGEGAVAGTVFKMQPDGSGFTVLKWFTNSMEGAQPQGILLNGGTVYGTTSGGGSNGLGTVFKMNSDGTAFTVLKHFACSDGANPNGGLVWSENRLFGTTSGGGSHFAGTVFRVNTDGTDFTVLMHFGLFVGYPKAGLLLSDDTLYGVSSATVFKLNTDGTGYQTLAGFSTPSGSPSTNSEGQTPHELTLIDNTLYGTASGGGTNGFGTVFKVSTIGGDFTVLKHFAGLDGAQPYGRLVWSDGTLYGTTYVGGNSGSGTVFSLNLDGTDFTVLKHFAGPEGAGPTAGLVASGGVLYGATDAGGSADAGVVFMVQPDGTDYTVLKAFTKTKEGQPNANLVLDGGTLYGTTLGGGTNGLGTVFKVNSDRTGYDVLKHFGGPDGAKPYAGLVLSGATLYGTTSSGGSSGSGTVFAVNSNGLGFRLLKDFSELDSDASIGAYTNSDGAHPSAGLVFGDGRLYGTTFEGGMSGYGTVFAVNTNGTEFTVLKYFDGSDGAHPNALVVSGGKLFGTCSYGGGGRSGTVFTMSTTGMNFSVLKHFSNIVYDSSRFPFVYTNTDGAYPNAALVLTNNTICGITSSGGSSGSGTVFKMNTDGTDFAVLTTFPAPPVGNSGLPCTGDLPGDGTLHRAPTPEPEQGRLVVHGSALYGTTKYGGSSEVGTVFKMHTDGSGYTVLKDFAGYPSDGANPNMGLIWSDGMLYGTTDKGGGLDAGTIFSLAVLELSIGWTNTWPQLSVSDGDGSHVTIEWVTTPNANNNWQVVMNYTNILLTNDPQLFIDTSCTGATGRFYRAVILP